MRLLLRRLLARKPWQAAARLRSAADTMRRQRRMADAVPAYREYLAARPDDAMAWVMLGHCLHPLKRVAEADIAYAQAAALDTGDPYIQLCRVAFLHQTGREAEIAPFAALARAAGATDSQINAMCGEHALGANPADDATTGSATIWIDVSDLLGYMMGNRNLSGIQRVIMALVQRAIDEPERIACVLTRPWNGQVLAVSRSTIAELAPMVESGQGASTPMRALVQRIIAGVRPAMPGPGIRYIQAGGFWMHQGNPTLHAALRRAGALEFVLIHDLIPLMHPELCMRDLVDEFVGVLGEELLGVHGIIANSQHTAATARDAMAARGLPARPVIVTPLAHAIRPAGQGADQWSAPIAALRDQRFVLSVGTIERRKNHALLVRVWGALMAEGLRPPPLVFAGKLGWNVTELETALAETRGLDGLMHIIPGLSDAEIETLYRHCLFTAAPSLIEGWGLPIGESMARGKLCVTSDRGSMPEVGEGHAILIDPDDVAAAVPVFRRLLTDDAWRTAREAAMTEHFRPRDWPEVSRSIIAAALTMPVDAATAGDIQHPVLPPGLRYAPVPLMGPYARALPVDPVAHPLRLMLQEGWLPPDDFGCQMARGVSWLHLQTRVAGTLHVALAAARPMRITVGALAVELPADGYGMLRIPLPAGAHSLRLEAAIGDQPAGTLPWVRLVSVELVTPP